MPTVSETDLAPTGDALLDASDMEHFVCCYRSDRTYCGAPPDEDETEVWTEEVDCVVCNDLSLSLMFCPTWGTCLYVQGKKPPGD